jgi:hypothetical protein
VLDFAELIILCTGEKIEDPDRSGAVLLSPDSFETLGSKARLCSLLTLGFRIVETLVPEIDD